MHLTKVVMKKLYGTLDKVVEFNEGLNLLVGINGSGKTSVLNVIDWLLAPNFQRLSTTYFEKLELHFTYQDQHCILEATQTQTKLSLNFKGGRKVLAPITVKLIRPPGSIEPQELEDLLERYDGLGPEGSELPLWNFLAALPKPVVIALDRSMSAEANNRVYLEMEQHFTTRRRSNNKSPLHKVREVTSTSYNKYKFDVTALNERLKARIVMSALRAPNERIESKSKSKIRIKTERDIDLLEKKVITYLSASIRDIDVTSPIKSFFRRMKKSVDSDEKSVSTDLLFSQYMQIEEMAQAFNEFEIDSAEAYTNLKKYLDTVNAFLIDSKKQVSFSEPGNVLGFNFLNPDGSLIKGVRSIENLSSGEKQILILFTFLSFVAEDNRIFIVDEPELSLHPKWQTMFTDAFLRLKPNSTQLLLATHSPEIVGKYKRDCLVLLP
ncbi:MAG: AAA family ATPase [Nitrosomonadales bacterium]|nr:AAA family ATPase [Nitrosomonadales bacterium]